MGWASATDLFDGAVDVTLKFIPFSGRVEHHSLIVEAVIEAMYTQVLWEDWDTQDESDYYEPYLKNVMIKLGEIDPE